MLPTLAVLKSLRDEFGAYIVSQTTAPGWSLILLLAPFTPSPDLVIGDVTPDFDVGNFPVAIPDSGHYYGRDPANGDLVALFYAGAGVQLLFSTSNTARTWYGWAVIEVGTSVVLASELLPTPLSVVSDEDEVRNPEIGFHFPMNLIR